MLEDALSAHRAGDIARAAELYEKIIRESPSHFDALHMLGVVYHQGGEHRKAIDLFNRAIATGIRDAALFNNMGSALNALGRSQEAVQALHNALSLDRNCVTAYNNLGNAYKALNQYNKAMVEFQKAVSLDPGYVGAYHNMAAVCLAEKRFAKAEELFVRMLEIDSGNAVAMHMLASLRGETTAQAPDEHVQDLFDHYSSYFDSHLVRKLGYDVPSMISSELRALSGAGEKFEKVLDLGCGTGLVGKHVRDIAGFLVGVDLSPRMIDKARKQNIYDELHVGGIEDYLQGDDRAYDLIVCADVFPYVGELETVFRLIKARMNKAAVFVFSTEKTLDAPYILRKTGRYAHTERYLGALCEKNGLVVKKREIVNVRKQGAEWITGNLMLVQHP